MRLTIDLPAEVEQALIRRAAAEGKDVATYVVEVVTEKVSESIPELPTSSDSTHDAFMARLRQIIAMHPRAGSTLDDSRESIYAGRGE